MWVAAGGFFIVALATVAATTATLMPAGGARGTAAAPAPPPDLPAAAGWEDAPPGAPFAGHTSENLDPETLVTCLPTVCRERPLRPDYDARSLKWLLEVMSDANHAKPLRKQLVRNAQHEVVGWFLYFLERGGESNVVQMAASKRSAEAVLQILLADAWSQGSVVLSGRFEPGFAGALSSQGCALSHGPWMLVHSKQPDVLDAIFSGEAFLSRLEGEW